MRLKNGSNIELVSYAAVDKEEVRDLYLSWLNDVQIVENFGTQSMLLPKKDAIIDESFQRFTSKETIGFFIYDTINKFYVGTCKLDKISIHERSLEMGVMIGDKTSQRRGVGSNSVQMILDYAFNVLGMNRVWATCYSFNKGAQKTLEKEGLVLEGREREAVFRRGKYYDKLMYAILRKEYVEINKE